MLAFLRSLNTWIDGALWRSWLAHGLIAIPLAYLIGPICMLMFYLLREIEQYVHGSFTQTLRPMSDYVMDLAGPLVVCTWWLWVHWPHWL